MRFFEKCPALSEKKGLKVVIYPLVERHALKFGFYVFVVQKTNYFC